MGTSLEPIRVLRASPSPSPLQVLHADAIAFLLELSRASLGGMLTPLQWKDIWYKHRTGSGYGDRTQPYPGSPLSNPKMLELIRNLLSSKVIRANLPTRGRRREEERKQSTGPGHFPGDVISVSGPSLILRSAIIFSCSASC